MMTTTVAMTKMTTEEKAGGLKKETRKRTTRRPGPRATTSAAVRTARFAVAQKRQDFRLFVSPSASPPSVGRRSQGSEKASEKASVGKASRKSSETDWDPRKGPAPGIRWRSGAPPAPPPYEHNPRDLRSFPRWERRLKLWEKRVLAWMPAGEAAMLLLESLTGIAELETEHLALEKVNCETGIQTILDALRAPLSERSLYLKRLYLQEWETVGRQQGESVRDFVNRYRRVVQDLQSMQIGLEAAFSSEALGYRLLERCKLSPDQQRIVLVGSQQSFEYELVRKSLLLQFPEGKAPPPLFGAPSPHQGTTPKGTPKGNPKGGKALGYGKGYRPKTTYVTEDPDGEEEAADEEEDEPYEGEDAETRSRHWPLSWKRSR